MSHVTNRARAVWSGPQKIGFFDFPSAQGAPQTTTAETPRHKRHSQHVPAAGWHLGTKTSDHSCTNVDQKFEDAAEVELECSKNSTEHYLGRTISYCGLGHSGIVYTGKSYAAEGLVNTNISRPVRCSLVCLPHRVLIELLSRQPHVWACQAPIVAIIGRDRTCKNLKTAEDQLEIFADAIEISYDLTECTWKLKHQLNDEVCAPSALRKKRDESKMSYLKGKFVCSVTDEPQEQETPKLITMLANTKPSTYLNTLVSLFAAGYVTKYTNVLVGAVAFIAVYHINLVGASSCNGPILVNKASISTTDLEDGVQYSVSANLGEGKCIELGDGYVLRTKNIETAYSYTYMYSTPATWHVECCKWDYDCMTQSNHCDRDLCKMNKTKNVKKFVYCGGQKTTRSSSCAFSGAMNTQVEAYVSLDSNPQNYLSVWKKQTTALFEHVSMQLKDSNGATKDIIAERGDTLENWDQMIFETFKVADIQAFAYVAKMGDKYYCAHIVPEKPKCTSHDIEHPYAFFDEECLQPNFVWDGENYRCVLADSIVGGLLHSYFTACPSYMEIVSKGEELTTVYKAPKAYVRFQTKLKVVTSIFPPCESVEISDIKAEKGDNKEYKVSTLLIKGNTAVKCQLKIRLAKCNIVGPTTSVVQGTFYVKFNVLCGLLIPDKIEFVMASGASIYHQMPAGVFRDIDFAFYQTYHSVMASVYTVNSTWLDRLSLSMGDVFNYSAFATMAYSLAKMALATAAIYFAAISLTTGNWVVAAFFVAIPMWMYQSSFGIHASPLGEALQQTNLMFIKGAHFFAVGTPIINPEQSLSVAECIVDSMYAYALYHIYLSFGLICCVALAVIIYTRNPFLSVYEAYMSPRVVVGRELREFSLLSYSLSKIIPNREWIERTDARYVAVPNGHPTISRFRYTNTHTISLEAKDLDIIRGLVKEADWKSFYYQEYTVHQVRYKTVFMSVWQKEEKEFLAMCKHNYAIAETDFVVSYDDVVVMNLSGYTAWNDLYTASSVLKVTSGDMLVGKTIKKTIDFEFLDINGEKTMKKTDSINMSISHHKGSLSCYRKDGWMGYSGLCVQFEGLFFIQQTETYGISESKVGYVSLREDMRKLLVQQEKEILDQWELVDETANVRRTQRIISGTTKVAVVTDVENITTLEFEGEATHIVETSEPQDHIVGTDFQVLMVDSVTEDVTHFLNTVLNTIAEESVLYLTLSHEHTSAALQHLAVVGEGWYKMDHYYAGEQGTADETTSGVTDNSVISNRTDSSLIHVRGTMAVISYTQGLFTERQKQRLGVVSGVGHEATYYPLEVRYFSSCLSERRVVKWTVDYRPSEEPRIEFRTNMIFATSKKLLIECLNAIQGVGETADLFFSSEENFSMFCNDCVDTTKSATDTGRLHLCLSAQGVGSEELAMAIDKMNPEGRIPWPQNGDLWKMLSECTSIVDQFGVSAKSSITVDTNSCNINETCSFMREDKFYTGIVSCGVSQGRVSGTGVQMISNLHVVQKGNVYFTSRNQWEVDPENAKTYVWKEPVVNKDHDVALFNGATFACPSAGNLYRVFDANSRFGLWLLCMQSKGNVSNLKGQYSMFRPVSVDFAMRKVEYVPWKMHHGLSGLPIVNSDNEVVAVYGQSAQIAYTRDKSAYTVISAPSSNAHANVKAFQDAAKYTVETDIPSDKWFMTLCAPTGTGKTTLYVQFLAELCPHSKICVLEPLVAAASNAFNVFKTWIQTNKLEETITLQKRVGRRNEAAEDNYGKGHTHIVIMTYGKFYAERRTLKDQFKYIILDEIHVRTDASVLQVQCHLACDGNYGQNRNAYNRVVYLTATDVGFGDVGVTIPAVGVNDTNFVIREEPMRALNQNQKSADVGYISLKLNGNLPHLHNVYQVSRDILTNGVVLIFVHSISATEQIKKQIRDQIPNQAVETFYANKTLDFRGLPPDIVIVTTDALGMAVTITNCTAVVDFCSEYKPAISLQVPLEDDKADTYRYSAQLILQVTSRQTSEQRKGRTGRTCKGVYLKVDVNQDPQEKWVTSVFPKMALSLCDEYQTLNEYNSHCEKIKFERAREILLELGAMHPDRKLAGGNLKERIVLALKAEGDPVGLYMRYTISREWLAVQQSKDKNNMRFHHIGDQKQNQAWATQYFNTFDTHSRFDNEAQAIEAMSAASRECNSIFNSITDEAPGDSQDAFMTSRDPTIAKHWKSALARAIEDAKSKPTTSVGHESLTDLAIPVTVVALIVGVGATSSCVINRAGGRYLLKVAMCDKVNVSAIAKSLPQFDNQYVEVANYVHDFFEKVKNWIYSNYLALKKLLGAKCASTAQTGEENANILAFIENLKSWVLLNAPWLAVPGTLGSAASGVISGVMLDNIVRTYGKVAASIFMTIIHGAITIYGGFIPGASTM